MKRKLIQQMRNEWRSNLWMTVELVIVGLVLWGVSSVFAAIIYLHQPSKGLDLNNIYFAEVGCVDRSASTYKEYPDSAHNVYTDLATLLDGLRSNPYVESLGTGTNALPYNFNYSGWMLNANIGDSVQHYVGNMRNMDPDMVRTLRLTGVNGETPDELAKAVEEGKMLISTHEQSYYNNNPELWANHEAYTKPDSTIYNLGPLIHGIRRSDYEPVFNGTLVADNEWFPSMMALRIRPGMGRRFMESLRADQLEYGNVYVYNFQDIEDRKASAHLRVNNMVRNLTACAVFVLAAVFLGFLGTFWYRTQQRVPELALRKVNGATDTDLFRRFISEGLLLLTMSAPFIIAFIALLLTQIDLQVIFQAVPKSLAWAMIPVTFAVLAIMIIAGVWLPARKAMKINPAEALKDQ